MSAPFHCVMLEPAGKKLRTVLEDVAVNPMTIPVVANVTGKVVPSEDQVKDLLVQQVSKSVFWEDSVRTMIDAGVDTFVEIGPGKVLSLFCQKDRQRAQGIECARQGISGQDPGDSERIVCEHEIFRKDGYYHRIHQRDR